MRLRGLLSKLMKSLYSHKPEIDKDLEISKDLAHAAMGELLKYVLQTKSPYAVPLAFKLYIYLTKYGIINSRYLSQVMQHPFFVGYFGYYPYTLDELKEMFKNYRYRKGEEVLLLLARVIEERNLEHVKKLLERRDEDAIAVIMNVLDYFVEKNCTTLARLIVELLGPRAREILQERKRKATEEIIDKMIGALLSTPTFYPPRSEEKIQPPAAPEGQQLSQQKSESGGNTQSLQPSCCSLSYSTIPRVDPLILPLFQEKPMSPLLIGLHLRFN